jgi:hypothetical protein
MKGWFCGRANLTVCPSQAWHTEVVAHLLSNSRPLIVNHESEFCWSKWMHVFQIWNWAPRWSRVKASHATKHYWNMHCLEPSHLEPTFFALVERDELLASSLSSRPHNVVGLGKSHRLSLYRHALSNSVCYGFSVFSLQKRMCLMLSVGYHFEGCGGLADKQITNAWHLYLLNDKVQGKFGNP